MELRETRLSLIAVNTAHVVVDPATGRIDTGVAGFYDKDNALVRIEGQALNFDAALQIERLMRRIGPKD